MYVYLHRVDQEGALKILLPAILMEIRPPVRSVQSTRLRIPVVSSNSITSRLLLLNALALNCRSMPTVITFGKSREQRLKVSYLVSGCIPVVFSMIRMREQMA